MELAINFYTGDDYKGNSLFTSQTRYTCYVCNNSAGTSYKACCRRCGHCATPIVGNLRELLGNKSVESISYRPLRTTAGEWDPDATMRHVLILTNFYLLCVLIMFLSPLLLSYIAFLLCMSAPLLRNLVNLLYMLFVSSFYIIYMYKFYFFHAYALPHGSPSLTLLKKKL